VVGGPDPEGGNLGWGGGTDGWRPDSGGLIRGKIGNCRVWWVLMRLRLRGVKQTRTFVHCDDV
jgi:hypothetical protein